MLTDRQRIRTDPVALDPGSAFRIRNIRLCIGDPVWTCCWDSTVVLDAAVISFWSFRRGQTAVQDRVQHLRVAADDMDGCACVLCGRDSDPSSGARRPGSILPASGNFWASPALTIVYFLLSSWIITLAIALEQRLAPLTIWRDNFAWISLNYFGGASVAAIIVSYHP